MGDVGFFDPLAYGLDTWADKEKVNLAWFDPDVLGAFPRTYPIDVSVSFPWTSALGLSSTAELPYEWTDGGLTLSVSSIFPWESLLGLHGIPADPIEWTSPVDATKAEPWESNLGITRVPTSEPWEALQRVSAGGSVFEKWSTELRDAAANTSTTISFPVAPLAGEVIVFGITIANTARTVTPPAGWTLLASFSAQQRVYYRVCDGTEGTDLTISLVGSGTLAGGCIVMGCYTGVDTDVPIDVFTTKGDGTSVSHTYPTISVLNTSGRCIGINLQRGGNSRQCDAQTGGWTEQQEVVIGGFCAAEMQDKAAQNPGTYGGGTFSESPFAFSVNMTLLHLKAHNLIDEESLSTPSGTVADSQVPWESFLGLSATKSEPWESQSPTVGATGGEPVESLLGLDATKSEPWESLAPASSTGGDPSEWAGRISATGSEPIESLLTVAASSSLVVEALLAIASDAAAPLESGTSLTVTGPFPWESAGGVIQLALEGTLSLEWLASVVSSGGALAEILLGITSDGALGGENQGGTGAPVGFPWESERTRGGAGGSWSPSIPEIRRFLEPRYERIDEMSDAEVIEIFLALRLFGLL